MKPNPICITKQKFRFENEGERDLEKKRTDEIPYTNLCCIFLLCLMLLSLSVPLFFSSPYVFAVCVYLLFFFFFFVSPFFFLVCDSLYSQKNSKETVPLFSSQLISSWSSLSQFFFHNS